MVSTSAVAVEKSIRPLTSGSRAEAMVLQERISQFTPRIVALWVAHTHAIDAAECTPYLHATSATKRAGKTRLLEAVEPLVARPWFTGRTSAAALVRKIDDTSPTLLFDEADANPRWTPKTGN